MVSHISRDTHAQCKPLTRLASPRLVGGGGPSAIGWMDGWMAEPQTNTDFSVFIRILKLITDEKLKNRND